MIPTVENQTWRSQLSKWRVPAALFLVVGLAALRSARRVGPFHLTHWTFTYEHGFIKRALVGDVVGRIVGPPSTALLTGLSFALTIVLAAMLLRLFLEPARREARFGAWLFALVAGTHSGTISNLVYDVGRFDQIGLLILLGCLAVLRRGTPTMRWVLVPATCVIGLLVHEAFLFMSLPLILAIWHYEDAGSRVRMKLVVMVCMIGLAWIIGNAGRMTALPIEEYVAQLEARHAFPISANSARVLYVDSRQNLDETMSSLLDRRQLGYHAILLLTMLPTLVLFGRIAREFGGGDRAARRRQIMIISALAPLALYAFGIDIFRWWAVAVTNLFITFAYLAVRENAARRLAVVVERMPVISAGIVVTSMAAGPLGILRPYPLFLSVSSWTLDKLRLVLSGLPS